MLRRLLLWVCLVLPVCTGFAQTRLIEKLRASIDAATTAPDKLNATLAFCDAWESYSPDTLHKYAHAARQMAIDQKNARAILLADYYKAAWLFQANKLDSAMKVIDEVIAGYTTAFKYDDTYLKLYGLRGNVLTRTARMDELMAHNFELLKLTTQHRDTLGMARATLGIGNVKLKLKSFDEALEWYHNALRIMQNPLYKRKLSFIYNNIAITFYHLSIQDSAEFYVKQGLKYSREDENLTNLANSLFVYGGFMAEFNRLKEAEASFKEGVEVRKQIGDVYYLINDLAQLALFYANNKEPQKGIALCKEGLALAIANGQTYSNMDVLYEVLGKNYLVAGDYKSYSEILNTQLKLKDSTYRINTSEEIAELQTRYEVQKKENTIIQQELDLTRKNYLLYGSIVLSIVILAAGIMLFRNYRKRQRLQLAMMLAEEKRSAANAVKEASEQERVRIAADLHDNLGAYAASMASNLDSIQLGEVDSQNANVFRELRNNSMSIISQLNDTIWVLKKDSLSLTAISDRIKVFISRIQPSYPGIEMDVKEDIDVDYQLSSAHAFHLYRVLQEAINNALKHSKGKKILVSICSGGDNAGWKVSVSDNGQGMVARNVRPDGGNGLANMQARSREAGWAIEWMVNNDGGTTVSISPTTN
ncbi:MAG TPA: ATP-binding protein [Chitinophagaceae bacterium]|nr:ATP-binding protein [Chitinophagaceae bacterium]